MSRSRHAILPLVLGLFAGTGCGEWFPTTASDPYDDGVSIPIPDFSLRFYGGVTSVLGGGGLSGVTVRIDAPAREWTVTVETDSAGHYITAGLPGPFTNACTGLSVSFSREGYQPLRVIDFPQLTCERGYWRVNARLTPTP
jgi:hypothetical protein